MTKSINRKSQNYLQMIGPSTDTSAAAPCFITLQLETKPAFSGTKLSRKSNMLENYRSEDPNELC